MISIQALYDYKSFVSVSVLMNTTISIQALYDYKVARAGGKTEGVLFQFKHCTIIRPALTLPRNVRCISIQALYDYKFRCIRFQNHRFAISIQALYDYKANVVYPIIPEALAFQFKHCTIIRISRFSGCVGVFRFQFKHCTIIRSGRSGKRGVQSHFNSSIVRL